MTPKARSNGSTGRSFAARSIVAIGSKRGANGRQASSTPGNNRTSNSSLISLKAASHPASKQVHYVYVCAGCNKPIKRDKFLLKACDQYWHENCLRCDKCHTRLGELGSTLYFKSDMNLCRQDYLEMFGQTGICSVCNKLICASEMVMRAKRNVYHLECFACQLCSQRFCVGDRFYLCENKIVCQYDYEEIYGIESSTILPATSASSSTYPSMIDSQVLQVEITTTPDQISLVEPHLTALTTASSAAVDGVPSTCAESDEATILNQEKDASQVQSVKDPASKEETSGQATCKTEKPTSDDHLGRSLLSISESKVVATNKVDQRNGVESSGSQASNG